MSRKLLFSFAPDRLWQSILAGWFQGSQFGLVNIDLGTTAHPEVEQAVLDEVGTYGRQIGRISDALEVLVDRLDRNALKPEDRTAIDEFRGQLAEVRKVKQRILPPAVPRA